MHIKTRPKDLDEPKTLKVSVPLHVHLRLHSLKILQGTNVSDTVRDALEAYFDGLDSPTAAQPAGETVEA